jgi:hypothetical protein
MLDRIPPSKAISPKERVGILLVHGIGEQRQFEHLLEVTRNMCRAMEADRTQGTLETEIILKTKPEGAYASNTQTWSAEKAPIILRVRNKLGFVREFEFHEVWWADLAEPSTFTTLMDFWFWGTSLWSRRRYTENLQIENTNRMRLPTSMPERSGEPPKRGADGRLSLFGLSGSVAKTY